MWTNEELNQEVEKTNNNEDGVGVVSFDDQAIWRNEPIGAIGFLTVCYCRKCGNRWESCSCQDEG